MQKVTVVTGGAPELVEGMHLVHECGAGMWRVHRIDLSGAPEGHDMQELHTGQGGRSAVARICRT